MQSSYLIRTRHIETGNKGIGERAPEADRGWQNRDRKIGMSHFEQRDVKFSPVPGAPNAISQSEPFWPVGHTSTAVREGVRFRWRFAYACQQQNS